ncbi:beta/gamma crystallin-related protein [Yersinia bercovieri]|uniref:beta/gamma crystallin-related protein n=1 Tax=Yersinia bercovieri TaxID=634 RepID=UPI0011AB526D|nr:beta/gamma crystallin-related protein [Yersinia bercovieri]
MIKNNRVLLFVSMLLILNCDAMAEQPKVCFYANEYYLGDSFCAAEGFFFHSLFPQWNDRISSIKVPYGMTVTLYENVDFSGHSFTLNSDTDLLHSQDLRWFNDKTSSLRVKDAVCIYESDNFIGDAICLSEGKQIDLYSHDKIKSPHMLLNSLNDQINSITVPRGMQVTAYKNDNFSGDEFTLTETYSFNDLKEIGMDNHISSLKVYQDNNFLCDHSCAIKKYMTLPIRQVFGDYWIDEKIGAKQMLLSFKLTGNDEFLIFITDGGLIKVGNKKIYIIYDRLDNAAYFDLNDESESLSMLARFNGGYFEVQFIESMGTQPTFYTPLIGYLFDPLDVNINFFLVNANTNENRSIIIDKIVMTAEKVYSRKIRDISGAVACWSIPLLNIYNYIVQGHCNQVDRFVSSASDFFNGGHDKILQVFGSSKPLPKISANEPLLFADSELTPSSKIEATLTHVNTSMDKKSLTIPATALACQVSMKEQLLPHIRSRRDLNPCIHWTLNIMTDFTLLFGGTLTSWNNEIFGQVIARILQEGNTGYAVSDVDTETRLINNVREYIAADEHHEQLHLKTAFDFSQLGYATYLYFNNQNDPVVSPQNTQTLSLGRYELALETFNYVETIPRIHQNGYWVEYANSHFEIEIITGAPEKTLAARQRVIPTISEWRRLYKQEKPSEGGIASKDVDEKTHSEGATSAQANIDGAISASHIVSDVVDSWLRTSREDYVYVIVRLAGRIVSITLAVDINETDVGIAGSLTDPAYVLHPASEGTIRGGGTAAIRGLARYAASIGRRTLVSEVISQPSAIVKKKVGFTYTKEL